MVAFTKFYGFSEALAEKVHNLGSDTLKVVLTNSAPDNTLSKAAAILSAITQLSNANGYTTGGATCVTSSSVQTTGTYKLVLADLSPAWTASGGSIGPFRYIVLYNDTATSDELIGFYDYGTTVTIPDGSTFSIDFDGSGGVLTIA